MVSLRATTLFARAWTVLVLFTLGNSIANLAIGQIPSTATPAVIVETSDEPIAEGKFEPSWQSLSQYQVPAWFQDAKFGIWAHWGPQCEPEAGDWYAREMYAFDQPKYRYHVNKYGHPSEFGFKDVIHEFKAEAWDPDKLVELYKRCGAEYFVAMASHHDNFDNYDSKYQPWNATNMGPKQDLIAGWEKAARKHDLRFGVSVHSSHAWSWYEPSQASDSAGPKKGVPYDGKLNKADGKGKWWEGYDPQDLYEQHHAPAPNFTDLHSIHGRWNWTGRVTPPDEAYCQKFYNRTVDLINKYEPDLLYFDDTALPLWPASDAGLKIAAHFYNSNNKWHGPSDDGVLCGKILSPDQRKCLVWDIERGASNETEPQVFQTDTCIGQWHYQSGLREGHGYKSAKSVVHMLIDIVSKNGNLLLSVPLDGTGQPDTDELAIIDGISDWMQVNKSAIHGTRPWRVLGEGPQMEDAAPLQAQGFNEGKGKPFTANDVRFTTKNGDIYAFVLGTPTGPVSIRSLGKDAGLLGGPIASVSLLGSDQELKWLQNADALVIEEPTGELDDIAIVFKITPKQ
jgi:alpha-L-fucosidase